MQPLTRKQLKAMNEVNEEDFVLINVLSPEDFRKAHIRTSVNVPVGHERFTDLVETIAAGKDRKVVVYCASFDCDASEKAARKLEQAGFRNVFDYEGGTRDWESAKAA